jgi:hypothetical protein
MDKQSRKLDNSSISFEMKNFLSEKFSTGNYSQFSVATGYWDLTEMMEYKSTLDLFSSNNLFSEIRSLMGEEPKIRISQLNTSFPEKYLRDDLSDLPFKYELKEVVKYLGKYIHTGRIKIKLYKKLSLTQNFIYLNQKLKMQLELLGVQTLPEMIYLVTLNLMMFKMIIES